MATNAAIHSAYRKRLPRYKFEASDRTLLQNLVNKYMGILERKATNQNMLEEKKRCWDLITNKFNSQSKDKRVRNAKQLRKCWENMKWRARRDAKKASINDSEEFDSSRMSGLVGVEEFMNAEEFEEDDDDEEEEIDDDEGEDEDDEEEEIMAPMGTESIEIEEDTAPPTNGTDRLIPGNPQIPPHLHPNHPASHPPDEELIGSFVSDSWIADDAATDADDQVQVKTEVLEIEPIRETHVWNGASPLAGPPTNVINHVSAMSNDSSRDVNHAPSVASSGGDAAESVSSRTTAKSSSRSKKSHENANRGQNTNSTAAVEPDQVVRSRFEEAERRLRADEEHAKRMELLQVQLEYEKAKVERMRRLMEMSEVEHRAKMRMMVRYQQVAEKQKEYWSYNIDTVMMQQGIPPTDDI